MKHKFISYILLPTVLGLPWPAEAISLVLASVKTDMEMHTNHSNSCAMNSDRYFSRESGITSLGSNSSFGSSKYLEYHPNNRPRANTGDSSSISSSENITSASSTANAPLMRRRSRPRGCRGGRKKKNQQARAAALAAASSASGEVLQEFANEGEYRPLTPTEGNPYSGSITKAEAFKSIDSFITPGRFGYFSGRIQPIAGRVELSCLPRGGSVEHSENQGAASAEERAFSFQPVLEKSSFQSACKSITLDFPGQTGQRTQPQPVSLNRADILPPPPPLIKKEPVVITGPNPYKLSIETVHNDVTTSRLEEDPVIGDQADYRLQRIHKQRLMFADGGSLFVTSPRTFLTGGGKAGASIQLGLAK